MSFAAPRTLLPIGAAFLGLACSAGGLQLAETEQSSASPASGVACDGAVARAASYNTDVNPPTWSWTACPGGARKSFRICLDDANCTPTQIDATSYTPGASLVVGAHQLFVSQQNSAGGWSDATALPMRLLPRRQVGSAAAEPDAAATYVYGYPTLGGVAVAADSLELAGAGGFAKGDVSQGGLGDCYFAAAVAAISFADASYLARVVYPATDALGDPLVDPNNYPLFTIKMPYADSAGNSHPWQLLTDAQLPRAGAFVAYAQPTAEGTMVKIGVPILEKAFAALDQDTAYLQRMNPGAYQDANGYLAIGEGGWAASAFGALAGHSGQTTSMADVTSAQLGAILPGGGVAAAADINSGYRPVPDVLPSGATMRLGAGGIFTYTPADGGAPLMLPNVHYYAFLGAAGGMTTWRNPWGGDTAESVLPFQDASAIFNRFTQVALPGSMAADAAAGGV